MFRDFWEKRPALFIGMHLFLAASFAFYPHYALSFPLLLLWAPYYKEPLKIVQGCALIAFTLAYSHYRYPNQNLPLEKMKGTAYFSISVVKPYESPFHKTSLVYQGTIKAFHTQERIFYDLPCNIYMDPKVSFPKADCDYFLRGELIEKDANRYVLKPQGPWEKVPHTFSFAHMRYQMKECMRHFLKNHTKDLKTLHFLSALATGDITERSLNFEFRQTGLLHILAISGFQFALIAAFFAFFLRNFLSFKNSIFVLLAILSFYYFFLGPSPSVQRSYIAVLFFFLGKLLNLSSSGLNLLGLGLIIEILFDPLLVTNLGFELTFLCTAAILLFYQPSERLISLLLSKRDKKEIGSMSFLDQHGYLLASWIRGALAMNLAVHFVSLPALLFLFHKIPLLSLAYNLFFPFLTTIMLFLLILTVMIVPFIPPLAHFLHYLNVSLTSAALEITGNPPLAYHFFIRVKTFSFTHLILSLMACFIIGMLCSKSLTKSLVSRYK